MGEQVNKKEPTREEKAEQKVDDHNNANEEKADQNVKNKTEEKESEPTASLVLYIDLHCVGCAKKIKKILTKMRGIEDVVIDMAKNQVTLKGLVEPQAICDRITEKTKRVAKVLSPFPATRKDPIPQAVDFQASEPNTVELHVRMHCEACADQLKKKILKMKGVQNVETELRSSKVTVTGTIDPKNLVDYVYRRTKKQAKIVPEPAPATEEIKPVEGDENKAKDEKQKNDEPATTEEGETEDEKAEEIKSKEGMEHFYQSMSIEEELMKKMYYSSYPLQQRLYVTERLPPAPQMFSDENPNACSIC